MIGSIIYVGREVLEMVFLTYLIAGALRINVPTILAAIMGLVSGIAGGYCLRWRACRSHRAPPLPAFPRDPRSGQSRAPCGQ